MYENNCVVCWTWMQYIQFHDLFCLFVCLFNDTMVSITDIRCHEDRHCRMKSLPKAPTHDQCQESNPRPLDLWSSALPTRPRDPTHNFMIYWYQIAAWKLFQIEANNSRSEHSSQCNAWFIPLLHGKKDYHLTLSSRHKLINEKI